MNKLNLDSRVMPSCNMGSESVFPPFRNKFPEPFKMDFSQKLPPEDYIHMEYGLEWNVLPYSMQNDYDRSKTERAFKTAVLENDRIRATFLLEFGARLWSLYDKKLEKELLTVNPVFQLGNLALRNAWFAGGIEWNCGWPGHFPYTAAPMHTVRVESAPYPVLRCFELERRRGLHWQIDFFLPSDDAAFLCTCVRLINPDPEEKPAYWWSNLAVPETDRSRILVPADKAYINATDVADLPEYNGTDLTYPVNTTVARDYFYCMKNAPRRWEAIVHEDGTGLICTSGTEMLGRKLFVWGQSQGGYHWQDFLLQEGATHYCEIQSGLAPTQMGCVPIAGESEIHWCEAFGSIALDPETAHGDWHNAVRAAGDLLEKMLPQGSFRAMEKTALKVALLPNGTTLQAGSGWGALDQIIRKKSNRTGVLDYPAETIGDLQKPWLDLLNGAIPGEECIMLPSFMISREWQDLLHENALTEQGAASPWVNYQLALGAYDRKQFSLAQAYLNRALDHVCQPHPRAMILHAKAMISALLEKDEQAVCAWSEAMKLLPHDREMLQAALPVFTRAGKMMQYRTFLPENAATHPQGRFRQFALAAALECDDLALAEQILREPFEIPDMQEGEVCTSELFFLFKTKSLARREGVAWTKEYHQEKKVLFAQEVPWWLDFRMGFYVPR